MAWSIHAFESAPEVCSLSFGLVPHLSPEAQSSTDLTPEMFQPQLASQADSEMISRPVIGYFQDAMIRLRCNKAGMTCFAILVFLILAGIVGPFLFPNIQDGTRYENVPNTSLQNQEPTLGGQLLVLEDDWSAPDTLFSGNFKTGSPLLPSKKIAAPANLKLVGQGTVEGVTLRWEPMEGISGYDLYRVSSKHDDIDITKLKTDSATTGMLLGRINDPAQYSFTDSLGLDSSQHYAYAIVPFVTIPETGETASGPRAAVIKADLTKTIKLSDAKSIDANAEPGKHVRGRIFLFGADSLGRDIFARMIAGARVNFSLALVVPTICLLIGFVYGSVLGLIGGRVDLIFMRIIEVLDALPYLLLMIILQLVMGKGMLSLIIAMCAFGWTGFARTIRGEVLRLREAEFVQASRLLGAPLSRLIFRHIAPNLIGLIIVVWSSRLPGVIISEAFLSLLGLGLEPPTASWGMVLNDAAQQFQSHPLQFMLPSTVMATTLLAFFLLGDALSDAFDPKLRGRD